MSEKGRTVERCNTITPMGGSFAQERDPEHGANESFSIDQRVIQISLDIEDVNDFPVEHGAAGDRIVD